MAAALRRRVARGPQLARTAVASQLNTVTGEGRMLVTGDSADRSVLATLFNGVPLTRPELATRTGLSRPTISEAVRRLVETGLIVPAGVLQYIVEEAAAAGIGDVLLVTGRGKTSMVDHFDRKPDLERRLTEKGDTDKLAAITRPCELAER